MPSRSARSWSWLAQIARDNGFGDRIVCIHELSTRASLPEPVDVIVTDGAGRFGFEAGLIETLSDARRRFLKPGGRVIPSGLTLSLAPVEAPEPWAQVDFWARPIRGLSFAAAHAIARSTGYPRHLQPDELLSEPAALAALDPSCDAAVITGRVEFEVRRSGTLHGIGGWFAAELAPGVLLTNAPGAANRINRRNVFFPLREPVPVHAGDRVSVSMHIRPRHRSSCAGVECSCARVGRGTRRRRPRLKACSSRAKTWRGRGPSSSRR